MKRIFIALPLFLSLGICADTTTPSPNMQPDQRALVLSVLLQPVEKQTQCAQLGYIGYQNALSARYLNDKNNLDIVKAYAWNLVSASQIKTLNNPSLTSAQAAATSMVEKKMTPEQITAGEKLSQEIIHDYGKSWPAPTSQINLTDFPAPCSIAEMYAKVKQELAKSKTPAS